MAGRLSDQQGFAEHRIGTLRGCRLYVRDYDGDRTRLPVLCLPGLARHSRDFHDVAMRLAPARRVVVPDYRGRGFSDPERDWRDYTPQGDLADLKQIAAALGMERVIAVGTSYGGLMTMGLGALAPTLLAAAVINDIGPDVVAGGQARIMRYIAAGLPQPDWPSAARHLRELLPTLSFTTDAEWDDFARATYHERDGTLHVAWDPAIAKPLMRRDDGTRPDLWALFRSLRRVPTLSLRGALTDLLSTETWDRMADTHPGMIRAEIPGCGHAPSLAEPASVSALDRFLANL
jgi:pimeloyl-ACP methyl ester carboxylesterase